MENLDIGSMTDNLLNNPDLLSGEAATGTAALITSIVVGVIVCFLGLKVIKILAALMGLFVGAGLGTVICQTADLSGVASLAVIIVAAIVMAALSFFIYRFGVFIAVWCAAAGACVSILNPRGMLLLVICVAVSLILAILAAVFVEPMIIISTGLSGGLSAGIAAASLAGFASPGLIGYAIGIVLALAGIGVQFMMQSRKIGKKEMVHAEKFKEQASMETEVEKARKMLEDDIDEDE